MIVIIIIIIINIINIIYNDTLHMRKFVLFEMQYAENSKNHKKAYNNFFLAFCNIPLFFSNLKERCSLSTAFL